MTKCPLCQFENEDGALFCEQCKTDLSVAEPVAAPAADHAAAAFSEASVAPDASVSEVASPLVAVAIAEAGMAEAVPVAQLDAGVAAAAEMPIAVAVPLPDSAPVTVAPDMAAAGMAFGDAGHEDISPSRPSTVRDLSLPNSVAQKEAAASPDEPAGHFSPDIKPKLVVIRGQRMNVEYPLYEGDNYLGRADEKAVDIDLEDQEPPDRVWSSRQHALIRFHNGVLTLEDLNSTNGTFVNRMRVHPGQKRPLQVNDVVQIGTVHLKVMT